MTALRQSTSIIAFSCVLLWNGIAVAADVAADNALMERCDEVFAWVEAPSDRVRPYVPDQYRLAGEGSGIARLQITVRRCDEMTVGGITRNDTREARVAAVIQPPDEPSDPVTSFFCCNYYLLSWATTHQDFAGWLKDGTGLGQKVHFVPDIAYSFEREIAGSDQVGLDLNFHAASAMPSDWAFDIDGIVTRPPDGDFPIEARFWADSGEGEVIITGFSPNERLGWANGTVSPRGTALKQILGATPVSFFGAPFSAGGFEYAHWSKEVRETQLN